MERGTLITISHTHEEGTLVEGTRKGDGAWEILRKHGFHFFPSIRAIGIRQSRDQVAQRWKINGAAAALREAGFEVEVEIDDTPRDRAQVLEDKAERLKDRRYALAKKAERHADKAASSAQRANELSERFAGGQPILVGHHSERGARRDQERMHSAMRTSVEADRTAQEVARRANAVGSAAEYSAKPTVTARRIKTAEAELRKIQKNLDGYIRRHLDHAGNPYYIEEHKPATGDYREQLLARKVQLENQLEYDQAQLAAAAEAGEFVEYGPHNVHVGDTIAYWRMSRSTVLKVNRVTVNAESGYSWPDKVKFTDIRAIECPHGEDGPVVLAAKRPTRKQPAAPKVEVPTIDRDDLAVAAQTASNLVVSRDREAFVSPPAVVERLMELADVQPGMAFLEPSAGTGNIAAAAVDAGAVVDCVEIDNGLANVLVERVSGVNCVRRQDFLDLEQVEQSAYDRIVMNPPFSGGKDIAHVTHALRFLKPGGRLVAVMAAGVIFHQSKAAEQFRALVEERGGEFEPLPAGSFAPATDINTVVVVIPAPEA
ncbi:DUF3560 domain-containing protein [Nonomuraea sp. NPDC049152]|uniref:DUF3560 domain-containing protein n=1 Tax=Nonomuraea sp. NPDC049152 TaxID=3154350 RepID=UPI0033DA497B